MRSTTRRGGRIALGSRLRHGLRITARHGSRAFWHFGISLAPMAGLPVIYEPPPPRASKKTAAVALPSPTLSPEALADFPVLLVPRQLTGRR